MEYSSYLSIRSSFFLHHSLIIGYGSGAALAGFHGVYAALRTSSTVSERNINLQKGLHGFTLATTTYLFYKNCLNPAEDPLPAPIAKSLDLIQTSSQYIERQQERLDYFSKVNMTFYAGPFKIHMNKICDNKLLKKLPFLSHLDKLYCNKYNQILHFPVVTLKQP